MQRKLRAVLCETPSDEISASGTRRPTSSGSSSRVTQLVSQPDHITGWIMNYISHCNGVFLTFILLTSILFFSVSFMSAFNLHHHHLPYKGTLPPTSHRAPRWETYRGQDPNLILSEIIKMYASVTSAQGVKDISPLSVTERENLSVWGQYFIGSTGTWLNAVLKIKDSSSYNSISCTDYCQDLSDGLKETKLSTKKEMDFDPIWNMSHFSFLTNFDKDWGLKCTSHCFFYPPLLLLWPVTYYKYNELKLCIMKPRTLHGFMHLGSTLHDLINETTCTYYQHIIHAEQPYTVLTGAEFPWKPVIGAGAKLGI